MNVLEAARQRIKFVFDTFEVIYLCFSGGKDSTIMFHLAMDEARKRNRKIDVLFIDLEAQYKTTIRHIESMFSLYGNHINVNWACVPLTLRNALSVYEPNWVCWEDGKEWVREKPNQVEYDFHYDGMEFEEFTHCFGRWISKGKLTACMVGIRADESLNRELTLMANKDSFNQWTTKIHETVYNCYPIYDWKVSDLWVYTRAKNKPYNKIYDLMQQAGVSLKDQRICQPYGDDQKKGIWLYHLLEPETWEKVINRVSGVNSGSLYVKEKKETNKPESINWKQYTELLVNSMPKTTKEHYIERITKYCKSWETRGYEDGICYAVPDNIESRNIAPSWKAISKAILKNDYWFRSINMTQPFSKTYGKYLKMKGKI